MTKEQMKLEIALMAFRDGFAVGANTRSAHKRHVVEAETHKHWKRGYEAGRAAVESEETAYRKELNA
jgi:hypothetical protein